jgi:N-acetylglucosamine kinase-like BadF-type ATPase
VRQFDGRGPATLLTPMILEHLDLSTPKQLIHEIYYRDVHRHTIAGIAGLVQRAMDERDAIAAEILRRAGAELASAAASVIGRLQMRGDAFPTVLAGGIFRGIPWLVGDITRRLSEIAPRTHVQRLEVEPAVGAVRLALAAAKGSLAVPTYV